MGYNYLIILLRRIYLIQNFLWIISSKFSNSKNIICYSYFWKAEKTFDESKTPDIDTYYAWVERAAKAWRSIPGTPYIYAQSCSQQNLYNEHTMVLCTVLYELLPLQSLSFIPHSSSVSHPSELHAHIIQHSILTMLLIFFFCFFFFRCLIMFHYILLSSAPCPKWRDIFLNCKIIKCILDSMLFFMHLSIFSVS